jgi:5'-3' exonuclease
MGIKGNFKKYCGEHFPNVFVSRPLSAYAGMTVAVDVSVYINKCKATLGDRWLSSLEGMFRSLTSANIYPIVVFDGPSPKEKKHEQDVRRERRRTAESKIERIRQDAMRMQVDGVRSELINNIIGSCTGGMGFDEYLPDNEASRVVENHIDRVTRIQLFTITDGDFACARDLCVQQNLLAFQAESEAETLAAAMCKAGIVDAVMSEDSDLIALGCPVILTRLHSGFVVEITIDRLLRAFDFTMPQLLDLCIMCGTDYNANISQIGVVRAESLMRLYKSIDNIPKDIDITILNHVNVRKLFSTDHLLLPDINEVRMWKASRDGVQFLK